MRLPRRLRQPLGHKLVAAARRLLWPRGLPPEPSPPVTSMREPQDFPCESSPPATSTDDPRVVPLESSLPATSKDEQPWRHPFLTHQNIRRFRRYSAAVWDLALAHARRDGRPLKCAFSVNMNQSMYKWARLAKKHGAEAALFLNPMDGAAINLPAWEDYDGEFEDIFDGERFERQPGGPHEPDVPCHRIAVDGADFGKRVSQFRAGDRKALLRLMAETPGFRHEVFVNYTGFFPYYEWARALADYDVAYAASHAFAAYASGRPYCVFPTGADLIYDCGRADDYGAAAALSYNAARFLTITNPHPLGHCRRLGLTNAVYLPYPMDDERYCPGPGMARSAWCERSGGEVFVLATVRLDAKWKGQDEDFLATLAHVARRCPSVRFVFLVWGKDAQEFRDRVETSELKERCLLLPPVGKKRLIDYYRSADIVLDQMVMGYYGATALEAAAVGRPVVMKLRTEHYDPLYEGDVAPIVNVERADLAEALVALANDRDLREERGRAMRAWLVRNHGERRCVPLMLAVLRLTADRVPLPPGLVTPLLDDESDDERSYHAACAEGAA